MRKPDYYLGVAGHNLGETLGNVLSRSYQILCSETPDAILILGDTNSALAAIPAKRLKIPIFHMEAGNRCFDENLPEEINRKIVDHISDVNLAYSEHARRYLFAEGIKKSQVFVVGSPMREVLNTHKSSINESKVLEKLKLEDKNYILLSAHREENIDNEENFLSLMNAVNAIASEYDCPVIYSVHPRSAKFIKQRNFKFDSRVRELVPFGFFDYIKLQQHARCVVSDSGTLAEESSILRFPAVSIRTSTERPEVLDKGGFVIGGISEEQVLQAIALVTKMVDSSCLNYSDVPDYNDTNVSDKIVKLVQSYTTVVNKMTWRKY